MTQRPKRSASDDTKGDADLYEVRQKYLDIGTIMMLEDHNSASDLTEVPTTLVTQTVNVADAHDLQHFADNAQQELSIERTKLAREIRRSQRLQLLVDEYIPALAGSVQDCAQMQYHCQLLSSSNVALSQELQKAKLMVETLEAVIQMLYISSPSRLGGTGA